MNDPENELEAGLKALKPAAPAPALRDRVLEAVRRELDGTARASEPHPFDRIARSPRVWAALAASALILAAAAFASDWRHKARVGALLAARGAEATATDPTGRGGLEREVLALVAGDEARAWVRSRLRLSTRAGGAGADMLSQRREWLGSDGS